MSKIVDVRSGGGDFVILGKALVLPASSTNGVDLTLDGSIRFNPESDTVEVYSEGSWSPLGGSGSSNSPTISQVTGLVAALAAKAPLIHAHTINDVTGLQPALDLKSNTSHTHGIANIVNLQSALDTLTSAVAGKANTGHLHEITNVTGLTDALAGKALVGHVHTIANVTGLQSSLDINKMQQYAFCIHGNPVSSLLHVIVIGQRMDIPKNFVGSFCHVNSAPTSNYTIQVTQNGLSVGSIIIDTSGRPTFTTNNVIVLLAGDQLEFTCPTQDATLNTLSMTILGERK